MNDPKLIDLLRELDIDVQVREGYLSVLFESSGDLAELDAFVERIRADERERCANVCEDMPIEYLGRFGRYVHTRPEDYAAAIRNSSSDAAPTAKG